MNRLTWRACHDGAGAFSVVDLLVTTTTSGVVVARRTGGGGA